ncbi:hypothetical protein [Paraburkholderia caballeronis]|uniref:hypothetical protein n=1 Tax=Paraburkholderia caballeronis TaxID=416943 RepID=UPI00089C3EE7|nr:hypothetical protein [Paraburkholderia caballeronis]SEB95397.1 hypothetical protein SAMN05445871_1379 [Paraburkholderia caballeronis]
MKRSYDYRGHTIEVTVEIDSGRGPQRHVQHIGFVAVVRVLRTGSPLAFFSPLRIGAQRGYPFTSADDAFDGGFIAGQRIIEDLMLPDAS